MYTAPQYKNERNVHMGIDIWAPAGEPVFAPLMERWRTARFTIRTVIMGQLLVVKHTVEGNEIFALYGHLSLASLMNIQNRPEEFRPAHWLDGLVNHQKTETGTLICTTSSQLRIRVRQICPVWCLFNQENSRLHLYPDPEKVMGSLV